MLIKIVFFFSFVLPFGYFVDPLCAIVVFCSSVISLTVCLCESSGLGDGSAFLFIWRFSLFCGSVVLLCLLALALWVFFFR